jgi:hypothetical protein
MHAGHLLLAALCAASLAAPAHAQTGPVIAIPGKVGVPVTINGVIVDGAVVYGDWGLARPGHGELVIEGPVAFATPWDARGYFPATGQAPRLGRQEVEPKGHRPRPTSFRRDWSSQSDFNQPVTQYPPFDPPPVIMAPRERRR